MQPIEDFVAYLLSRVVQEMQKEENKNLIKEQIVNPLLVILYDEMYPYIMMMLIIMMSILIFTLVSVIVLISRR
jgi:hypothetical protein